MKIKVGLGYDVHRLVEGRKLWLGGIEIPHHKYIERLQKAIHVECHFTDYHQ